MRVTFHTLGCKVNQYETEAMREQFEDAGHVVVGQEDKADAYIINTCTVTSLADRKSRQYIRRMKKKNPHSIVVVTGCYVQVRADEVASIEGVDIIAGTDEKENIISYVEKAYYGGQRGITGRADEKVERHILSYEELMEYHGSGTITSMESRTRAYIKIEDGCDRFCSYCVIPYARGKVRCRDKEEIISEAKSLIEKGFREIILTGINTALYDDLPGLLSELDMLDVGAADFRIRLSSLEPTVVDAEYVKGLFGFRRLCHHLHLSLQSGSDSVLSAMRRRYDMADYMGIVRVLRDFDPLYGISTDIIAGFPGETEKDFCDSLDAVHDVCFCRTHSFGYSKRPGTAAVDMKDQIPAPVKKSRVGMLTKAGESARDEFSHRNIGTNNTVIFEEYAGRGGLMVGYTDNYIRAYAPYDENLIGELSRVSVCDTFEDGVMVRVK